MSIGGLGDVIAAAYPVSAAWQLLPDLRGNNCSISPDCQPPGPWALLSEFLSFLLGKVLLRSCLD